MSGEGVDEALLDAVAMLAGQGFDAEQLAEVLSVPLEVAREALAAVSVTPEDVDGLVSARRRPGRPRVMTPEQVAQARELRGEGLSYDAIARQLGVKRDSVRRAVHGDQAPVVDEPDEPVEAPAEEEVAVLRAPDVVLVESQGWEVCDCCDLRLVNRLPAEGAPQLCGTCLPLPHHHNALPMPNVSLAQARAAERAMAFAHRPEPNYFAEQF